MFKCIDDKNNIISAYMIENEEEVRKKSKEGKLSCLGCQGVVEFYSGKLIQSHFKHKAKVGCGFEPEKETDSHVKGKCILYDFLETKFPNAFIEMEYYLKETGQIADIIVIFNKNKFNEIKWAFEFQHSKLSTNKWDERQKNIMTLKLKIFGF